jgi:transposase
MASERGDAVKAYSLDLRERVLKDCDAGLGTQAVAEKYSVSQSWIRRLKQRRREDDQIKPRPSRNKRVPKLAAYSDQIRALISETPDLTLKELREKLGVAVALGTLWTAVARLDLTVKKKSHGRVSRTART